MVLDEDPREKYDDYQGDVAAEAELLLPAMDTNQTQHKKTEEGHHETSSPSTPPHKPEVNSEGSPKSRRKSSSFPCLVGNAHIHLQLLVEDVKVELNKDLSQNRNSNCKFKTDSKKVQSSESLNKKAVITDSEEKSDCEKDPGWRRFIGIIFAITASMLFPLCVLIVKLIPQYHPYNVSLWRFQGIFLPAIPIAFYLRVVKKEKIFDTVLPITKHPKTLFLLFFRGIAGASAIILRLYALQYISVGDSTVIAFSTPVFVSLASHFILGEKSGFVPVICGVITLTGVAIITRPPILTGGEEFDEDTLIGAGLSLGFMLCSVAVYLLLRYLREMHFSVMNTYFGLWGTLQCLALSSAISEFHLPETMDDWMLAGALIFLTFIGQTCITLAFKYEQAGTVSLCRCCDVLFAYVWQFLFLGEVPDLFSMVGGGVVVVGILVAAGRKYLSELPEDNETRKRWWILLT